MPHKHSIVSAASRYRRAVNAGYVRSRQPVGAPCIPHWLMNPSLSTTLRLEVPAYLYRRARLILDGLAIQISHCSMLGKSIEGAFEAASAAYRGGYISYDSFCAAKAIHVRAASAKHKSLLSSSAMPSPCKVVPTSYNSIHEQAPGRWRNGRLCAQAVVPHAVPQLHPHARNAPFFCKPSEDAANTCSDDQNFCVEVDPFSYLDSMVSSNCSILHCGAVILDSQVGDDFSYEDGDSLANRRRFHLNYCAAMVAYTKFMCAHGACEPYPDIPNDLLDMALLALLREGIVLQLTPTALLDMLFARFGGPRYHYDNPAYGALTEIAWGDDQTTLSVLAQRLVHTWEEFHASASAREELLRSRSSEIVYKHYSNAIRDYAHSGSQRSQISQSISGCIDACKQEGEPKFDRSRLNNVIADIIASLNAKSRT